MTLPYAIHQFLAQLVWVVLAFQWTTAAEEKSDASLLKVRLSNKNQITGKWLDSTNEHRVRIESAQLKSPISLRYPEIRSITFPDSKNLNPETAKVTLVPRFRMTQGDTFYGRLREITAKHVILDTRFAGKLTIPRGFVESVELIKYGKGHYCGPNKSSEWQMTPIGSWRFTRGIFSSTEAGRLHKDVKLTEKSHIRFCLTVEHVLRFRLYLYTAKPNDPSPPAYYQLNFNRLYAYLKTRGTPLKAFKAGRWQQITPQPNKKTNVFDVFSDRKKGEMTIYLNGIKACSLTSHNPDPKGLGTSIAFEAEERYPMHISDIRITPWDGTTFPKTKHNTEDPFDATDSITDNAGKHIPFLSLKFTDKTISLLSTDRETRSIPLTFLKKINLLTNKKQPKKYRYDSRFHFHQGHSAILRLDAFKNGKIHAYHQALGKVTLDPSFLSLIECNIYANSEQIP